LGLPGQLNPIFFFYILKKLGDDKVFFSFRFG